MEKNSNNGRMMSNRDIAVIIIAALLMTVAAGIQYFYMRNSIVNAATQCAKSDLTISCQQIETEVTGIETAVNMMGNAVMQNVAKPDAMYDIALRIMKENPMIESCVVAFKKGYYSPRKDSLFAPCLYKEGENYNRRLVQDYLKEPWYDNPAADCKSQWSEPYVKAEGSRELFVTYSSPVIDAQGKVVAILAANVPVASLTKAVDGVEGYPHSQTLLTSKSGQQLIETDEIISQEDALVFSSEIGKVGWSVTTVCPNEDINNKTKTARIVVLAMQALALLLLLLIVIKSLMGIRRLGKTAKEKKRMDDELGKASEVQEAMLPTERDDLPRTDKVETFAKVINAREIGGDFLDCFIDDNRLFFCIGDVAGKGAPAALLMVMAKSAFRVSAQHQKSPSQIISEVNGLICKMNDGETTIKMLGGVLDLTSGTLEYSNAGMHSPILLTSEDNSELEVVPNVRIGIDANAVFEEQQTVLKKDTTLFLYTDGLTEAENKRKEQWGIKRLSTQLSSNKRMKPENMLMKMENAIKDYTEGALLVDDITMLTIRFLG